jgi:DNA-binding beta-propeller fold protein YncE
MISGRTALRRLPATLALLGTATLLAACGHGGLTGAPETATAVKVVPERVVSAPKGLLAAAAPQASGTMWALAGATGTGLFDLDSASGQVHGSVSVSSAARSVTESSAGVLGVALGARTAGALELRDGHTGHATATVPLPAPARQAVVGSDGSTFYVLSGWHKSASVTVVSSQNGKVHGTIPVPADTVSIAPDVAQASLYALEATGLLDEIGISSGQITARFKVGEQGMSIALNPDGNTLYVLKGTPVIANIAVVNVATESVRHIWPAPSHCRGLLVSASGRQLYEVVGTPGYGNIQVLAL